MGEGQRNWAPWNAISKKNRSQVLFPAFLFPMYHLASTKILFDSVPATWDRETSQKQLVNIDLIAGQENISKKKSQGKR